MCFFPCTTGRWISHSSRGRNGKNEGRELAEEWLQMVTTLIEMCGMRFPTFDWSVKGSCCTFYISCSLALSVQWHLVFASLLYAVSRFYLFCTESDGGNIICNIPAKLACLFLRGLIYSLWLFNSLPWKITMLLIGKASINEPFSMAMLNTEGILYIYSW